MKVLLFYVTVPHKEQPDLFILENLCCDYRCSLEAVRETLDPSSHQMDGTTDVAKDDNASVV